MTDISQNALSLLKQRYFHEGENWESLIDRVVDNVCVEAVESKETIRQLLLDRVFLPNSPVLANAGTTNGGLLACFVRYPEDTLEDSFEAIKDIASVAKRGGGCGWSSTKLRPKGAKVAGSAHGTAYGANRFSEIVSFAMDAITQNGLRKFAGMYTLSGYHDEIEDFIGLKQGDDPLSCYNFNQSVMITDEWMNNALKPETQESRLFDMIARHAWNNGEPGMMFETTINENTPYKYSNQYLYGSNPCSEQTLPNYGACCLASINLNHDYFNSNGYFDYTKLEEVTVCVTQFLNDVGTVNTFPNEKFADWYSQNRPIGIGIMGLADVFLRYGVEYGEQYSFDFLNNLLRAIYQSAKEESERLGDLLGVPESCSALPEPRRNITLLSIAPTGSIAIIADCSHGIEPIFSPSFKRIDERGKEYLFVHPKANEDYFVSAIGQKQPTWKQQIDLLKVCYDWVDSGVSKTINLPNDATVQTVKDCFTYAWQSGVKGLTVYRDGSRSFQILNDMPTENDSSECPSGVCNL